MTSSSTIYLTSLELSLSYGFSQENASDILPPLGALLSPYFASLTFQDVNVSYEAQSSLFVSTISYITLANCGMLQLGDVSNLTLLQHFQATSSSFTTLSAFTNSSVLSLYLLSGLQQLTGIEGAWPQTAAVLRVSISDAPLLTTVPSFANVSNMTTLLLVSVGMDQFLELPTSNTSALSSLFLSDVPLTSIVPLDLSYLPLANLAVRNIPILPVDSIPNFTGTFLGALTLTNVSLTTLPLWVCNMPPSAILTITYNNLSSVPNCLASVMYQSLDLTHAGPNLRWLPPGILYSQYAQRLVLQDLPGLVANTSLTTSLWNLPSLSILVIPSQYMMAGVPPSGSVLGTYSAALTIDVVGLAPIQAPIPYSFFPAISNATAFFSTNVGINGTIPDSISSMTRLGALSLNNNRLIGTLPAALLTLPHLTNLQINNNMLSGPLPNLTFAFSSALPVTIRLDENNFDLCAQTSFNFYYAHTLTSYCIIGGYCSLCEPIWTGYIADCIPVPFQPSPPPVTASSSCNGTAPPSSGSWTCSATTPGTWVSNTSIVVSILITIGSNVTIEGNLTAPQLILSNVSTTVIVSGCINTTSLQLIIQQQDLDHLSQSGDKTQTLLQQNGTNCDSISNVPVSIQQPPSYQQVTTTHPSSTSQDSLILMFAVDSSSCGQNSSSTWWIILVGVIGGVILIAIAIALVVTLRNRAVANKYAKAAQAASPR